MAKPERANLKQRYLLPSDLRMHDVVGRRSRSTYIVQRAETPLSSYLHLNFFSYFFSFAVCRATLDERIWLPFCRKTPNVTVSVAL